MGSNHITLKAALFVSLSLHVLALASLRGFHFADRMDSPPQIEVTYIMEEATSREELLRVVPKNYDLPKKEIKIQKRIDSTPKEVLRKETTLKNQLNPLRDIDDIAAENLEDYISYYKLIRERIKERVTHLYKRAANQGAINVVFRINHRGMLTKMTIDRMASKGGPDIEKLAIQSIKTASPFPSFPKSLKKKELTFSIAIIFKSR